jgi:4-hydroxy-tetrahydrodipicolinate synthase
MTRFSGVYPILYAFFSAGGGIDEGAMRAQVEACLRLSPSGIAVLGLATEVEKLSFAEKRSIIALTAKMTAGRLPMAVTIGAATEAERFTLIDLARDHDAAWLILQPPPEAPRDETALIPAFAAMMARARLPIAIQHAPQYLGAALSASAFRRLQGEFADFSILKGEGSALETAQLMEETAGAFTIFAGKGGLEWPDLLRVGASGLIPAPEILDVHLAIARAAEAGDWLEADRLYTEALPLITFLMQSLASFRCYGKRLLARRLGIAMVYDREPALAPTPAGFEMLGRWSRFLPPWP